MTEIDVNFTFFVDPAGRNICMPIFVLRQGNEPPNFKGYFGSWDDKMWHVSFKVIIKLLKTD